MRDQRKRVNVWRVVRVLSACLLMAVLLSWVRLGEVVARFNEVTLSEICLLIVIESVPPFLGCINILYLLRQSDALPFRVVFRSYFYAWAIGLVSPGQVGDASQVLFLKRYGVAARTTVSIWSIDKAVTLAWTLLVSLVAAWLYFPVVWPIAAAVFLLLAVVIGILRAASRSEWRAVRALMDWTSEVGTYLRRPRIVAVNSTLTVARWAVTGCGFYVAFRAMSVEMPFVTALTVPFACSLVGYIPVSTGGVGTTEAAAVAAFAQLGFEASRIVAAYLLLRVVIFGLAATSSFCLFVTGRTHVRRCAEESSETAEVFHA